MITYKIVLGDKKKIKNISSHFSAARQSLCYSVSSSFALVKSMCDEILHTFYWPECIEPINLKYQISFNSIQIIDRVKQTPSECTQLNRIWNKIK